MINRLMISVAAAALIAGTGFANAQGTGMSRDTPSAAPTQQGAPSDRGASDRGTSAGGEMNRDAAKPEMKSTQSEQQSPAAGKNQRADEKNMPGQNKSSQNDNAQKKSMSSESENNAKTENGKTDNTKTDNGKTGKDMKAEGSEDRNGRTNADSTKGGAENRSQTVGQAGAGAKMSGEQRTKITTVIRDQHVQPVTNVNFSISVGTRVPREVSFHPLPAEIVTIYPDWRGYEFILVRNQIIVIDPQSFEIVAVLDA
jgi:Protein of unknown function (DUF1236)